LAKKFQKYPLEIFRARFEGRQILLNLLTNCRIPFVVRTQNPTVKPRNNHIRKFNHIISPIEKLGGLNRGENSKNVSKSNFQQKFDLNFPVVVQINKYGFSVDCFGALKLLNTIIKPETKIKKELAIVRIQTSSQDFQL
jgi:hypothetical protein